VLAAGVEPFALSALKYGLLALLFLFVWRAMRWVIRGLNVDQGVPASARGGAPARAGATVPLVASLAVFPPDGGKPRRVRIEASTTIGRAPECELRIDDTYASQQHARVFGKDGAWYVEDLGSTNGTYVNEQRLAAPAMLTRGDRIRVGTTVLELRT
jgi:pSer/pThr/pTyr-binding forkhead associated (FHA) protein